MRAFGLAWPDRAFVQRALHNDETKPAPRGRHEARPRSRELVDLLDGEMSRGELMAALGLRDEKHFRVR
ncbi:MAG TPA: hypothetical protein DFS52_24450 [Myxococcales bacterium]|nr:hypothetical protein [Myxococcales bacterium]